MDNEVVGTDSGQGTIQELVHVKHGGKEILGLQSNQIVKGRRKLRRKRIKLRIKPLRRRLMMTRKLRTSFRGGGRKQSKNTNSKSLAKRRKLNRRAAL